MISKRKSKSSYHHGNLRESIIIESKKWIKKHGIESLSLRELAKKLGVTHSAPSKHFPKKEALVAELVKIGFIEFKEALQLGRKDMLTNPKEAFIKMGLHYLKFARENPEIYRLMFMNPIDILDEYPETQKAGFDSFNELFEAITYLQEKGIVRRGNTHEMCYLIWSFTHGFVLLWQDGRIGNLESSSSKPSQGKTDEQMMKELFHLIGGGILS